MPVPAPRFVLGVVSFLRSRTQYGHRILSGGRFYSQGGKHSSLLFEYHPLPDGEEAGLEGYQTRSPKDTLVFG